MEKLQLETYAKLCSIKNNPEGAHVIDYGEIGSKFYVMLQGEVRKAVTF